MNYKEQPRLVIFKNSNAGNSIKKSDGSFVTDSNGDPIKQSELNGKINLPESLEAGDYEVSIYKKEYADKKTGELKTMYSGRIKKAYVKKAVDEHSQAKANGYTAQNRGADEFDNSVPF